MIAERGLFQERSYYKKGFFLKKGDTPQKESQLEETLERKYTCSPPG